MRNEPLGGSFLIKQPSDSSYKPLATSTKEHEELRDVPRGSQSDSK